MPMPARKIKPPTPKDAGQGKVTQHFEPWEISDDPEIKAAMKVAAESVLAKRNKPENKIAELESRVSELEGDLVRLVELMGDAWGDVFKETAKEIVTKYQGGK